MNRLTSLFIGAMLAGGLHAQLGAYQFPQTFNKRYNFDPKESFAILNKSPLQGFTPEQSEKYRVGTIYNVQHMFDNNDVYMGWTAAENYLREVLDTIIPLETRKKHPLHVFLTRYTEPNAFALDNGFLFVNIGLLSICNNEAQLAGILAHETQHALGDHGYNKQYDRYYALSSNDLSFTVESIRDNYKLSRKYETECDIFGVKSLSLAGYDPYAIKKSFEMFEMMSIQGMHTLTLADRAYMREYLRIYSTHPEASERVRNVDKLAAQMPKSDRHFLVDSAFFFTFKRVANEEIKKSLFEQASYDECLRACFIDYLKDEKNLKNLYWLIESLRRVLYVNPKLKDKGFLTEEYEDKEFSTLNYSILKKPAYLVSDPEQVAFLTAHPLFVQDPPPFVTYPQALLYFCKKALEAGLNEANLTLALYYFSQKEAGAKEYDEFIKKYTETAGMNTAFAKQLQEHGRPYIAPGKKLIFIDNLGNYSNIKGDRSFSYNYLLALDKMKYNPEIKAVFAGDTANSQLVLVNQLLGNRPRLLYQCQKLISHIQKLYSDDDVEIFVTNRVRKRVMMEEKSLENKYVKHLFIFAPEWYKWFSENTFSAVCLDQIFYEHTGALNSAEFHNTYLACYLDFNVGRPYFRKSVRNGGTRKQETIAMVKELDYFLNSTE